MPSTFSCSNGHRWDALVSDSGTLLSDPVPCPLCGTLGNLAHLPVPADGPGIATATLPPPDSSAAGSTLLTLGNLPHASQAAPSGSVPGYEILGELGRGGMGVVY
jgi:hypothetical protein